MIVYDGVTTLLRPCLPPYGQAAEFRIGVAGPMYADNGTWIRWRRNTLSEIESDFSYLGGQENSALRTCLQLNPVTVVPAVTHVGDGAHVRFVTSYVINITWWRHGDWTPADWDHSRIFQQPWPWRDCMPYEVCHGFPWTEPIDPHPNWWAEKCGPGVGERLHAVGGRYIGLSYVAARVPGSPPRHHLIATSRIRGPYSLRVSRTIDAQVVLRVAHHRASAQFVADAARAMFGLASMPYADWRVYGVSADVSTWPQTVIWSSDHVLCGPQAVNAWAMREYVPDVSLPAAYVPGGVTFAPATASGVLRGFVVTATRGNTEVPLFWHRVQDTQVTSGDTVTLSPLELTITDLLDAVA